MKLKKELNFFDVFCIASGTMISSGLFILPGLAHAKAGPAVVISYFLAGLLALTGVLSQAELVSAMPKAGGTYFYAARSMGPAVGIVDGLITWFSLALKSAFALIGMAAFSIVLFNFNIHIIAIALSIVFIIINLIGIKEAGKLQIFLVIGLFGILIFYLINGLPKVNIQNFTPFAPYGTLGIFSTAGFVFVSYGGLLKIASIAEEVKNPGKVIPLAMISALLIVTVLYILVVFVTAGTLDANLLDKSLTPISDGAGVFIGNKGKIALSIAAILAFISTANAGIMAASRYLLALSRDSLLPECFGKINKRFRTPHFAIIVTGLFIIAALFFKINILVETASTVLIFTYIFSCLSIIILRESRLQNYQPQFRSPLYPIPQIIGIIGFSVLLFEMNKLTLLFALGLVFMALLVYWFYARIRSNREYALLHLIERITAKELTTHSLETELKEIIQERDDIIKDRFDKVIEDSVVLDIEESMDIEEFFELTAEALSEKLDVSKQTIIKKLKEREQTSTTVIGPHLAIPHIIVSGKQNFDILIARCRKGIVFSSKAPEVHAVFVLAGTKDERNFHLRALSAIAQIVQDAHFEKRWRSAKSEEALRDTVLLGKRKR
jgi:basic amino acid/polyamine antiporter, APA family